VPISEAKAKLNKLATSGETTLLSVNGKDVAYIVPYDEYIEMYRARHNARCDKIIKEADEHFKNKG
jgi:prevent-host-death family protein